MTTTLESRLPEIIAELPPRVQDALLAGLEAIAEDAKSRVAKDTGDLEDSIHVVKDVGGWSPVAGAWSLEAGGGPHHVFYGHLVEFGAAKANVPSQPFLVPAFEAGVEPMLALTRAAMRGL